MIPHFAGRVSPRRPLPPGDSSTTTARGRLPGPGPIARAASEAISDQRPPPTNQVAARTCLSLTSVRRRALNDRPITRQGVALTETALLREVAVSKKACRLNAVVRSSVTVL